MTSSFGAHKYVGDKLNFIMDWALWLDGLTIANSSWTVPPGLTPTGAAFDDTTSTIIIAGGEVGQIYEINNAITTNTGLIKNARLLLEII
jgi:hypothetical protein